MKESAMQIISRGALCVLLLFSFSAVADSGPSSNGDFQFNLTGATGAIQYNVKAEGSGARGEMTFNGAIEVSNEDVDGEGTTVIPVSNVTLTVSFDCIRVSGNRASMSGVVTSSSVPEYIGVKSVLAVEDNGEGSKTALDRFTWGVYRSTATTWFPTDEEVPGDTGATLTWLATDFEAPGDPVLVGIPATPTSVDCKTFPLGSYAFENVAHGAGNLQVKP
jgi:hypothetical protein